YGKMAATFVNLKTGKAVRVNLKDKNTSGTRKQNETGRHPGNDDYITMPSEDLFNVIEVSVTLKPEDMPGKPLRIVTCSACGERIMDGREIVEGCKIFCKPCATGNVYYRPPHK
ncbi:MAG TPA: TraR/DksA C4-type zinc finger protein, partial [Syntrophorhabdaceae bacterium]|nr:TraR/DksA C4-type zinc finger protein [Syntrophorhabdaceae bacterium]